MSAAARDAPRNPLRAAFLRTKADPSHVLANETLRGFGAAVTAPVVLSLGSNVGDRLSYLTQAVGKLAAALGCSAVSPVYETLPVGGPTQPDYLNLVMLSPLCAPDDVWAAAQSVEAALHRERRERWGPRTIDVDVVAVGDVRRDDPTLTIPHPRAAERAFVLRPWLDVDDDAVLPGRGRVAELLAELDVTGLRRRRDITVRCP